MTFIKSALTTSLLTLVSWSGVFLTQLPKETKEVAIPIATINWEYKESEWRKGIGCKDDDNGESCSFLMNQSETKMLLGFPSFKARVTGRLKNGKVVKVVIQHGKPNETIKVPKGYQLIACYCNQSECLGDINTPNNRWMLTRKPNKKEFSINVHPN